MIYYTVIHIEGVLLFVRFADIHIINNTFFSTQLNKFGTIDFKTLFSTYIQIADKLLQFETVGSRIEVFKIFGFV